MRIAILITNTDTSEFAARHSDDGEKFTQLIHLVRPAWSLTAFDLTKGAFPPDPMAFDGAIITGSPASVHDAEPWIAQLTTLIRDLYAAQIPMFGACFGHQAIAQTLGGQVGSNPNGWEFGLTESQNLHATDWMSDLPETVAEYAAHNEQVLELPPKAQTLTTSKACRYSGFHIGNTVYTTQNHPEMTPDFMDALVTEYAPELPPDVAKSAKSSLANLPDTHPLAQSIARFFEMAKQS